MATEAALAVAAEYKERQERVRAATTRRILAVYAALEAARAVPSWRAGIGDAIFALISAAQEQAAVEAETYIRRAAAAQGITIEGPRVNPRRFAAIASDNRPLDTLLVSAPLKVAQGIRAGRTPAQAKHAGEMSIRRIIETQVPDAARAANSVVIATARSTQQPGLRAGRGNPDARARAERIRRALATTTLSPEREADIERRLKARAAQDAAKAARELQDEPIVPTGNPKGVSLGYVRMLTPPSSCDRCVILAGRWYRWNQGFERHPMCFPEGTLVQAPGIEAASRRWYEGELVTIGTASGKQLSLTANHPVLTDRGWVPANLLMPGDEVFDGANAHSALGNIPDHKNVPVPIEDIFSSLRMVGTLQNVPSATEDFHGDGIDSNVDIVLADRPLGLASHFALAEIGDQPRFALGGNFSADFTGYGGILKALFISTDTSDSIMCGGSLGNALLGGHLCGANQSGFGGVSDFNFVGNESLSDYSTRDLVASGYGEFGLPSQVLFDDFRFGEDVLATRWDAPPVPFSMETRAGYASRGKDLILRLTGQIAPDRVVSKMSREWSGHVYSLTSSQGWMVADGIVTSNCDCVHIPAAESRAGDITVDPMEYFDSLSEADQNKYFGKANSRAIREGADITQVVNQNRTKGSMFTADDGRRYTNEGLTRRSLPQHARKQRGLDPMVLRPTVWQIYRDSAGNREAATQALRDFGYIL